MMPNTMTPAYANPAIRDLIPPVSVAVVAAAPLTGDVEAEVGVPSGTILLCVTKSVPPEATMPPSDIANVVTQLQALSNDVEVKYALACAPTSGEVFTVVKEEEEDVLEVRALMETFGHALGLAARNQLLCVERDKDI